MTSFTVYLQPNKKANKIGLWLDGETIKIDVIPQPVEGKANKALIALLSKHLRVSKSRIEIVRGATTRMKRIKIDGLDEKEIKKNLKPSN